MNEEHRQVLRSVDRLRQTGRSFGVSHIASDAELAEDAVRELLDSLHPEFVGLAPISGDDHRIYEARRIELTAKGRHAVTD